MSDLIEITNTTEADYFDLHADGEFVALAGEADTGSCNGDGACCCCCCCCC